MLLDYIANLSLPKPILRCAIQAYSAIYGANLAESAIPQSDFQSFMDFFTRPLKDGVRPIQSDFVSPVDGELRAAGQLQNGDVGLVKGHIATVSELLANNAEGYQNQLSAGSFYNFYLAPGDYHRVHAPISGKIIGGISIPGKLYPVNTLGLSLEPKLFIKNKRKAIFIESSYGLMALIMVGALNVGGITLDPSPREIKIGEELGRFMLGSAVILLTSWRMHAPTLGKIKLGDSLSFLQ